MDCGDRRDEIVDEMCIASEEWWNTFRCVEWIVNLTNKIRRRRKGSTCVIGIEKLYQMASSKVSTTEWCLTALDQECLSLFSLRCFSATKALWSYQEKKKTAFVQRIHIK